MIRRTDAGLWSASRRAKKPVACLKSVAVTAIFGHSAGRVPDQRIPRNDFKAKQGDKVMAVLVGKPAPDFTVPAVLGNGEVVLVLDIQELEDRFRAPSRQGRGMAA